MSIRYWLQGTRGNKNFICPSCPATSTNGYLNWDKISTEVDYSENGLAGYTIYKIAGGASSDSFHDLNRIDFRPDVNKITDIRAYGDNFSISFWMFSDRSANARSVYFVITPTFYTSSGLEQVAVAYDPDIEPDYTIPEYTLLHIGDDSIGICRDENGSYDHYVNFSTDNKWHHFCININRSPDNDQDQIYNYNFFIDRRNSIYR